MNHKISIRTKNDILSLEDFKERGLTNESVIGIILQTEVMGIIISKYQWEEVWSNKKGLRVFEKMASEVEALQILNGLESTKRIVDQQQEAGESMTAAIKCWYYDEGSLQWYLPSLYELATIIAYRDGINDVLDALGLFQRFLLPSVLRYHSGSGSLSPAVRRYSFCPHRNLRFRQYLPG